MDSLAHTTLVDSETVKENFVVAHKEIVTETVSRGEAWIPQRILPFLTMKESRKTESLPT
jgi:hypothetical protein